MTGLVALDIVIGLVFIYLLYSLFATVLIEIITTNIGLRARNLFLAVIRMLSDEEIGLKKSIGIVWLTRFSSFGSREFTKKPNDLAVKFYQAPGIKYLNSGGIFSKPSEISSKLFAETVLDILTFNLPGNNIPLPIRLQNYFANSPQTQSDVFNHLHYLFTLANGDLERFKSMLEDWYNEMMQRVSGWYKKRVQIISFFVGFLIAIAFNINTFYIVKTLSKDDKARNQFVELAGKAVEKGQLKGEKLTNTLDSLRNESTQALQLLSVSNKLPEKINYDKETEAVFLDRKVVPISFKKVKSSYIVYSQPVELNFLDVSRFVKDNGYCYQTKGSIPFNEFKFKWTYQFWGWLVTAIAISLGSPFWFDLLNRLMQLRGSLVKESSSESKKKADIEYPKDAKG